MLFPNGLTEKAADAFLKKHVSVKRRFNLAASTYSWVARVFLLQQTKTEKYTRSPKIYQKAIKYAQLT
jgi:hypothetical protein